MSRSALSLERVIGLTTLSATSLTSSKSGDIFYAAGCVVVRYDHNSNRQSGFFTAVKSVSCVAISRCEKYLAVGERGHQPCVCVFDIESGKLLTRLSGHKHGIGCMSFSPDSKYLVSCGFKHDKQCLFWDWSDGKLDELRNNSGTTEAATATTKPLFINKIGNKVNAVDFHESGKYFVTCGDRHFKFWYVDYVREENVLTPTEASGAVFHRASQITGKPAYISKTLAEAQFMDVVCGSGGVIGDTVYTCTVDGTLCAFHSSRTIDSWINLESTAYTLTLFTQGTGLLLVGCADGVVRAFTPQKLSYTATLPLPAPLHANDALVDRDLEYPACYALTHVRGSATDPSPKLAAIYADRSLFVWDISDIQMVAQYRVFSFHRACLWDICFIDLRRSSRQMKNISSSKDSGKALNSSIKSRDLPAGSFATCSADGTIRIWNLEPSQQRISPWKSPYSREMLHCIDLDDQVTSSQDSNFTSMSSPNMTPERRGKPRRPSGSSGVSQEEGNTISKELAANMDTQYLDLTNGVPNTELPHRPQEMLAPRAMAIHPCGTHITCGDKVGRIRVYDLQTMQLVHSVKSHAAEVLALHYSPPMRQADDGSWVVDFNTTEEATGSREGMTTLLASAGRDRLVHIYDVTGKYTPVTTLDNHSSSITALKFTADGKKLLSCGGDKTMVFSSVTGTKIQRVKSISTPHGTINGLALEPTNKFAISSGQDKRLNVWNINSGRHMRSYKSPVITQELYKADVDPSGMFVACSAFDKTLNVFDFFSGELLVQVAAHSEVITGVKFSLDGRHLVSIGGDGCIMVWKVSESLVTAMQDRLVDLYGEAVQKQASILRRSENNLRKAQERERLKMLQARHGQVSLPAGVQQPSEDAPALPPAPPAEEVTENAGKWADRLKGGNDPSALNFTNVVESTHSNISASALSSVEANTNNQPLTEIEASATARTIEDDDGVLCGSDSDLSDDDDDDGEALFSCERVLTPSPLPGESELDGLEANDKGTGAAATLSQSQEGINLRASLEESKLLDMQARSEEEKAQEAIEKLEQSANDLESWLEAKLKNDKQIDSSALPRSTPKQVSVSAVQSAKKQNQGADVASNASLNGINDDSHLMSLSLTAAFFQSERLHSNEGSDEASLQVVTSGSASAETSSTTNVRIDKDAAGTETDAAAAAAATSTQSNIASAQGEGEKRPARTLETKRRETSAVLANMKHQLQGMGLYEGTVGLPSSENKPKKGYVATKPTEEAVSDLPAVVMPPSPPQMLGFKVNDSIELMRNKISAKKENDASRYRQDVESALTDTEHVNAISFPSRDEDKNIPFNFSLTMQPNDNAGATDGDDTVTEDESSIGRGSRESLDFSLTATAQPIIADEHPYQTNTVENSTEKSKQEKEAIQQDTEGSIIEAAIKEPKEADECGPEANGGATGEAQKGIASTADDREREAIIMAPYDGDITSTEAEQAMLRSDINKSPLEAEDTSAAPAPASIPASIPTPAPVSSAMSPTRPSTSMPTQADIGHKLNEHKLILEQLNAAKEKALQSYNDLLGLRGGLVDVSSSFSSQAQSNRNPSQVHSRSAWTSLQEAESALGVTDKIISAFRESFVEIPPALLRQHVRTSAAEVEGNAIASTTFRSSSSMSSSSSTSTSTGQSTSTATIPAAASISESSVDLDKILDSHSDKIMEKLLAKLAAANPDLKL